jgi:glutamine---fructose-6-phosphate transaminase (isomerizing)
VNTSAPVSAGYLDDIAEQPLALLRQVEHPLPPTLAQLDLGSYDRIVLTGMGSSDYSAIPVERDLAARGLPVQRVDAGRLLDVPERVTANTLLWATSQSGRSGELLSLLDVLDGPRRPRTIIATTDDAGSPLAERADVVVELRSGPEATVSTKSYLNTLAAHLRATAMLTAGPQVPVDDAVRRTADLVQGCLDDERPPTDLADAALTAPRARFAFVGVGDDAATALTGALITKEASKVPVEGYVGGAFRHGPLELAGPGLTAVLFGRGRAEDAALPALARDLVATGSRAVTVGPHPYPGTAHLATPTPDDRLARLAVGIVRIQLFTIALSRATGVVPGEFRFGRKITDVL